MKLLSLSLLGALLAYLLYGAWPSVRRTVTVLGALRMYPHGAVVKAGVTAIPDTVHCEDLHYHAPSGTLFTACEDNPETRFKWFPPLANFDDPELASRSRGSIHVVDPKVWVATFSGMSRANGTSQTMMSRRLAFENFEGPFITHGIDVIPDAKAPDGEAVYIVAVNHVPETQSSGEKGPHARSQLEVFHHVVGSSSIRHLRSVWHPLIKTPNDVFAESPTSIYVTNDHRHRFHGLMRALEDLYRGATWTEVVHVQLDFLAATEPTAGVAARIALPNIHNSNGLGHGRTDREILISSCTSGVLLIGQLPVDGKGNITVTESVEFDHVVDNPSYFADPFATPGDDHSGFLEAGVSRGIDLSSTQRNPAAKDPVMVTYIKPAAAGGWEKRLLLEDDGTVLRSVSAAVLVAIDPTKAGEGRATKGPRQAWLFATGFLSKSMIAFKVDL